MGCSYYRHTTERSDYYSGILTAFIDDLVDDTKMFRSDPKGLSIDLDDGKNWGTTEVTEDEMWCNCNAWERNEDRPVAQQIPCPHIVVCAAITNVAPPNLVIEVDV